MRLGTAMCWGARDYAKLGESDLTPNPSPKYRGIRNGIFC